MASVGGGLDLRSQLRQHTGLVWSPSGQLLRTCIRRAIVGDPPLRLSAVACELPLHPVQSLLRIGDGGASCLDLLLEHLPQVHHLRDAPLHASTSLPLGTLRLVLYLTHHIARLRQEVLTPLLRTSHPLEEGPSPARAVQVQRETVLMHLGSIVL